MSDDKQLEISLPGEWALKKAFGPVLGELGEDMKKLYSVGRDKILLKAYNKIDDKDDGKKANLRVARDVFWNGSFTDEEICAEYFGGILASSRSENGKDDNGIHYADVIKSLSSKQLELHYIIYNSLNKLFLGKEKEINVGQSTELHRESVWFSTLELASTLSLKIDTDLNVLYKQGLLHEYKTDQHRLEENKSLPYIMVKPTTFGVLLYAIAHNSFGEWRRFSVKEFGDFKDIKLPKFYGATLEDLLEVARLKDNENSDDKKNE